MGLRGGDARRPGGGRVRRGGGAGVAVGPPDRPAGRSARAGFGATVRGIRPGPALPHDAERATRRVPKDRAVRPRRQQRGPQVRSLPPGGGRKDLRRGPRRLLPRTAQAPNGDLGLRGRADPGGSPERSWSPRTEPGRRAVPGTSRATPHVRRDRRHGSPCIRPRDVGKVPRTGARSSVPLAGRVIGLAPLSRGETAARCLTR